MTQYINYPDIKSIKNIAEVSTYVSANYISFEEEIKTTKLSYIEGYPFLKKNFQ